MLSSDTFFQMKFVSLWSWLAMICLLFGVTSAGTDESTTSSIVHESTTSSVPDESTTPSVPDESTTSSVPDEGLLEMRSLGEMYDDKRNVVHKSMIWLPSRCPEGHVMVDNICREIVTK